MSNSSNSNNGPSWSVMGNSTCLPYDDPDAIWPYCPSEAAAILFAVLFGIASVANIFTAARYRKQFCWVLIMATLWETIAYSLRAVGTRYQQAMAFFFPQLLLILLSPLLINAFVYMVFARMVHFFDRHQKVAGIKARRLSLVFVLLDVASFLTQLTGASMLSGTDSTQLNTGKNVYMAGIGLQQACILAFVGLVIRFDLRARRAPPFRETNHRRATLLVYLSLALITVRIIFRLVEYSQGPESTIPRTESFQFLFDAVPMLIVVTLWAVFHPGRVLVGVDSEFPTLSRKEKKIRREGEKAAKRDAKAAKAAKTMGLEPMRTSGAYEQLGEDTSYGAPQAYDYADMEEWGMFRDVSPAR